MKKLTLSFVVVLFISLDAMAFYQMRNWTLLPHQVNIEFGQSMSVDPIPNASTSQYATANGVYDEDNNLLFYVKDDKVYDANSNFIDNFGRENLFAETVIVPVPGECRKYYVIQAYYYDFAQFSIEYNVVNASNISNITVSNSIRINNDYKAGDFCGLAATKIISGSGTSAIRYLYTISYTAFVRYTISNSGIGFATDLTTSAIDNLGHGTYASEADLNTDGTHFLWGGYNNSGKVYEVEISNPNNVTTYTLPSQTGCSSSNQRINGVEYDFYDNIWVSASSSCPDNNGVYKITKGTTPSYQYISNTSNCNRSQIELLNTSKLLVVNNNEQIGELDPSDDTYSTILLTNFALKSNGNFTQIYTLNDQIDGEDYSYFNGIENQAIANFKINNVSPSTNCSSIPNFYNCNAMTLNNQSTHAVSYELEVISLDGNCDPDGKYNYSSGIITTLPTDLRDMPGTGGSYLSNNQGVFLVRLTASNGCTSTSKEAYIQVSNPPTAVTSCFTFTNNTTCSGSGIAGGSNCANAVSVCSNNPKIKGDCSGGQFVEGEFDIVIDEYSSTCPGTFQNVGNSTNNPLSSTNDLVCLSLNDFTTTPGYFYSNPTGNVYKVTLTIRNVCSQSSTTYWFKDDIGGCKTSGDDVEEDIVSSIDNVQNSNDERNIVLYPNPVNNQAFLRFNLEKDASISVLVYDSKGSLINTVVNNEDYDSGKHQLTLPTENLSSGMYMYRILMDNKTHSGKFIKTE